MNYTKKELDLEQEFLKNYKSGDYEKPSVTVDMLIFTVDNQKDECGKQLPEKDIKVLLIKRKKPPYHNCWAIPGGFVEIDESIETAANRELKEETNLEHVYMEQLYTWGTVERDPRMRVMSVSYMALVPREGLSPIAGDDAAETAWFIIKKKEFLEKTTNKSSVLTLESEDGAVKMAYIVIESFERNGVINSYKIKVEKFQESEECLAFDHMEIVNMALERLKNKVEYTPIAFNLVPEEFTLPELQQVYETILGKTLYKSNFRKKIMSMVLPTENKKTNVAHRPVQYYKFNLNYIDKDRL